MNNNIAVFESNLKLAKKISPSSDIDKFLGKLQAEIDLFKIDNDPSEFSLLSMQALSICSPMTIISFARQKINDLNKSKTKDKDFLEMINNEDITMDNLVVRLVTKPDYEANYKDKVEVLNEEPNIVFGCSIDLYKSFSNSPISEKDKIITIRNTKPILLVQTENPINILKFMYPTLKEAIRASFATDDIQDPVERKHFLNDMTWQDVLDNERSFNYFTKFPDDFWYYQFIQ